MHSHRRCPVLMNAAFIRVYSALLAHSCSAILSRLVHATMRVRLHLCATESASSPTHENQRQVPEQTQAFCLIDARLGQGMKIPPKWRRRRVHWWREASGSPSPSVKDTRIPLIHPEIPILSNSSSPRTATPPCATPSAIISLPPSPPRQAAHSQSRNFTLARFDGRWAR
ncbi:hypothetical protein EDB81DRAFT_221123 [Dactylonectria macrodidyma]|uniref:Secreted protein n=1 Tax=Dactylonectria macrodidyma TaxID=307937 RepID=A0A9P9DNS2_9HYPO|nr:hypothetical protein EDB81DRAFT_221123 [Dactylonectria macrodidyma]